MASSSLNMASPLISHVVFDKLTKANHVVWKAQVKVVVCGARLRGHLNGDARHHQLLSKNKWQRQ